ncbi:MAG: hypothetical protein ACO308_01700, partial [Burkholderiaceae bacterium]
AVADTDTSTVNSTSGAQEQDERVFLIFQADDCSEQQLDFLVSDIDQARLVPQLPFKERRP